MTTSRTQAPVTRSPATSKAGFGLTPKSRAARARAKRIFDALSAAYPDAHCELDHRNPRELLVATILSAQATDVGVNRATPALFRAFPTAADYAAAGVSDIEQYVQSIGLYHNKSTAIHAAMTTITERFDGEVPRTMDELLTLRGVARKTANVVLGNAYGINVGVVVDTHVARLVGRFALSAEVDPPRIERDLMALFLRRDWTQISHLLIWHGRRVCRARGATCAEHAICRRYCSNAKGR